MKITTVGLDLAKNVFRGALLRINPEESGQSGGKPSRSASLKIGGLRTLSRGSACR